MEEVSGSDDHSITSGPASSRLQGLLDDQCTWKGFLPCNDIVGYDEPINLFDYFGKQNKGKETIMFDNKKWEPTNEGLEWLIKHLHGISTYYGSILQPNGKGILLCSYGRKVREDSKVNCRSVSDFDKNGVLIGLRRHEFHNNRVLNRCQGHRDSVRANATTKDTTGERICRVRMTLRIDKFLNKDTGNMESFIILSRLGTSIHTFHPQPEHGDLPQRKGLLDTDICQLIANGQKAAVASTSSRKLVLEEKNCLVTKSTLRRVLECTPDFLTAQGAGGTSTSAEEMLGWLRRESMKPDNKIFYKVLSYQGSATAASSILKNSKGRPSLKTAPLSVQDVANQMVINEVQAKEGCLIAVHNVPSLCIPSTSHNENNAGERLSPNNEVEERLEYDHSMHQLIDQTSQRLQLLKCTSLSASRVMLAAVWMREYEFRLFLQFPEVLFIDATHKTNNEGRPLLLVCGRCSDGKVFIILRIFMPNETLSFYRWVFLDVFPSMLGAKNLKRVKLTLTDGDSQEFNALDESIFKYIQGTLRGRCGHHLIEKSFDAHGPRQFDNQDKEKIIALRVRQWIRTWTNGSSCGTKEQYELSRSLLVSALRNDQEVRSVLGAGAAEKMIQWIVQYIDCIENNYVFYHKRYLRCFDEYCTNAVEGSNNATKHSSMSAKPCMTMKVSAEATPRAFLGKLPCQCRKRKKLASRTGRPEDPPCRFASNPFLRHNLLRHIL